MPLTPRYLSTAGGLNAEAAIERIETYLQAPTGSIQGGCLNAEAAIERIETPIHLYLLQVDCV